MATETSYPIDYNAYDTTEIIALVEFLAALEAYHETPTDQVEPLIEQYRQFRSILANKTEEKRIDEAFYKQTGIRIFHTMQALLDQR